MRYISKFPGAILLSSLAAVFIGISGCSSILPAEKCMTAEGYTVYGGLDAPVLMVDDPTAEDVSYEQLMLFLHQDKTDQIEYKEGSFVCADAAAILHNNAEIYGIKSAIVIVELSGESDPHALNVFNTTDKGLVYIDCTGLENASEYGGIIPIYAYHTINLIEVDEYDAIAYVKEGKPYGLISTGLDYGLQYSEYERWRDSVEIFNEYLDDYNSRVKEYNTYVSGQNPFLTQEEYADSIKWTNIVYAELVQQEQDLKHEAAFLGVLREVGPIVESIETIWDAS